MDTNSYLIKRSVNTHIVVAILVSLTATASSVINGIITGQALGPNALTAFGLSTPVFILLGAISGILSNGGTISCSKYIGAGKNDDIVSNFTLVTVVTIVISAVMSILLFVFCDTLGNVFGGGSEIQKMPSDYIKAIAISTIPFLLVQNLLLYIRTDNNQRLALMMMVVIIVANTAFALWSCKCTDLSLFGIGLSIGVGSLAGLVLSIFHFRRKERFLRFGRMVGAKKEMKNVFFSGLPTAINRGSQTLKSLILNSYVLAFGGAVAVLSLSVQSNVYQFLIAISTGYGIVTAMMCGMFFGEKDRRSICDTVREAMISGFLLSCIAGAILFIFSDQIASLFISGNGDISMATTCLKFFAFSQPTSTLCLILLYMYQSLGNLVLSTIVSVTRGVGYVVLISMLLTPIIGLDGVWVSFVLADIFSILTIIVVVAVKTHKLPRSISDLIITKNEEFNSEIICDISISNRNSDIDTLSDRISEYCAAAGIPQEKSSRVALCIEELAGNVIDHAYDDDKEHFIDIRVVRAGDDVVFRIRDDGVPFNPLTYECEGHLGIKVVRSIAKKVDYRYSIKLNNLLVVV